MNDNRSKTIPHIMLTVPDDEGNHALLCATKDIADCVVSYIRQRRGDELADKVTFTRVDVVSDFDSWLDIQRTWLGRRILNGLGKEEREAVQHYVTTKDRETQSAGEILRQWLPTAGS